MKRMTCAHRLGIRTEELQRAGAEVVIEETEDFGDRRHQVVSGKSSQNFQAKCKGIANYVHLLGILMVLPMDGESDGPSNTLFMKTLPFGTSEIDVRPRAS
jgi:hypothetical protein